MKKQNKTIKRAVALLLLLCTLIGSLTCFSACTLGAPKVDKIYDRVVELIEAAQELNTVFYGAGLPVYAQDSEYAELNHLYFNFEHTGYQIVSDFAKFKSVDEIKAAAEKVFSTAYLEDVLYNNAFVGYAIEDGAGGSVMAEPRYYDDGSWIYRLKNDTDYLTGGIRIYDYSTMKIVAPSNGKACTLSISSYLPSDPSFILTDTIRIVKQEDGLWYLDSFTG